MKIDMSPHAVTMRLKKSSELRRLCIALGGERLKKRLRDCYKDKNTATTARNQTNIKLS